MICDQSIVDLQKFAKVSPFYYDFYIFTSFAYNPFFLHYFLQRMLHIVIASSE